MRWQLLDADERDLLRSLALGQLPLRVGDVIPVELRTLGLEETEVLGEYELVITLAVKSEDEGEETET